MKHIIISRLRFNDNDKDLMDKYLKISKEFFIPSIKNQNNKNFDLGIIINKNHYEYLKKELDYDFIPFYNGNDFKEYVIKEKYNIQTRHDIDDWMSDNYVDTIHNIYNENINKYDSFLIQFQPLKYMYNSNEEFKMSKYHDKRNSMFLTLCQKDIKNNIFEKIHGHMYEITPNIITMDEGYVKWIIHNDNISVKKNMVP